MKKYVLTFIIALILCAGLSGAASAAEYTDVPASHWAAESVQWALDNGLISADDILQPSEPVSRALLASILYTFEQKLGLQPLSSVRHF